MGGEVSEAKRRRGRPSAPLLTQEKITASALRLMAGRSRQPFTLDALASALGVSKSALYNHASSKATVLLWVQDAVNATIDVECFDELDCHDAMLVWARSYREAYAPYPKLVPLMAAHPIADAPQTTRMYEAVASALVADGWAEADVLNVIVAVESYVFGAALDLTAPDDIFDPGGAAEDAPTITRAVAARAGVHGRGRSAADAAFDVGLVALLDGLAASRTH